MRGIYHDSLSYFLAYLQRGGDQVGPSDLTDSHFLTATGTY